jgi:hypothetical protein
VEADWAVEIGPDLPRIEVPWSSDEIWSGDEADSAISHQGDREGVAAGARESDCYDPQRFQAPGILRFVDLRADPAFIDQIEETRRHPGLKRALLALNAQDSPVFTSKCDVIQITKEEIDPLEYDAVGETRCGLVYYIDLVVRKSAIFCSFSAHEMWLRDVVKQLRKSAQVRSARVDFVLRPATVFHFDGFAVTCYIAACGGDLAAAQQAWEPALDAVLRALASVSPAALPFPDASH